MTIKTMTAQNTTDSYPACILLGTIFLMATGGFSCYNHEIREAKATNFWPKTTGTIISSSVDAADHINIEYAAKVSYQYTVDGNTYTNNRIGIWETSASVSGPADELAQRYPVGSTVDVYYASNNPSDSLLQTGASWSEAITAILSTGWLVFAVVLYYGAAKQITANLKRKRTVNNPL